MKARISLVFISCILVYCHGATAQAISQGVLLNQQSMQNAGSSHVENPIRVQSGGTQTGGKDVRPGVYDPTATPRNFDEAGRSKQPFLSEYAGYVTPGTQLTISSPVPSATIYYTIDGWTPTEDSLRYVEPLTIERDMRVQAFAVEPGMLPSPIDDATYIVKPQQPPP